MSVDLDIELRSVTRHLRREHGSLRSLSAGELVVLIAGGQSILVQLRNNWSVVTGRSRAGWDVAPVTRGFIGYKVRNNVDYSQYVHRRGEGARPAMGGADDHHSRCDPAPIVERLIATISETERYSQPAPEPQRPMFLSTPRQQTIGLFSQVRRLRRLVRRR